jgi:hypothetical protein
MINNPVYSDNIVRGSDLQVVVDAINANEVFTDNMTIIGNKSEAGISISVVDQYGGGVSGGKGGAQYTFRAKIKTYTAGTGIYTVDIYNNGYSEPATSEDIVATPTITTFTPLGIGEKAIVMLDEVETLGDNES